MEAAVVLLTLACYALTVYLWWHYTTPIFFFTLLSGHIGALASPLWIMLYGVAYRSDLPVVRMILDQPLLQPVLIGSAWFYTLPALLGYVLYRSRWWSPNYFMGIFIYGVFLLYHLLLETIGLRFNLWSYSAVPALPFDVSQSLLSSCMAAFVSLGLLYILLLIQRFAWPSLLIVLLPATLALSLIVHGIIGAPLWISRLLSARELVETQQWATIIGLVSTLVLLVWALHIVNRGLGRLRQRPVAWN